FAFVVDAAAAAGDLARAVAGADKALIAEVRVFDVYRGPGVPEGKASIAAAVTEDLVGKVSAVDLVRAGVETLGGKGGGGRPDMAQGGGPDGTKAAEAVAAAKAVVAG
ncbi:MAG: DHHA1 domain-containing protein, partial [Novosphingobium sp.]|nr:DHHA1 domain-containing protein [Novosphingobium sp.]